MSAYVTIQTYKPQGKYNYMHKNISKIFIIYACKTYEY